MAADPLAPAIIVGDGWDEVRRLAPGDTGRRLARLILEHLAEQRAGELVLILKFSRKGEWYTTRFQPAEFECRRRGDAEHLDAAPAPAVDSSST